MMKHGKYEAGSFEKKPEISGKDERVNVTKNILLYLHDLAYLLGVIVIVLLLCLRVVIVSGSSMKNTLVNGDYLLLLSSTFYRNPQQGDIIVASKTTFKFGEPIIKRVIATEGQTVDIDYSTGTVYVDGVALSEPYISSPTIMDEGTELPLTVDKGCVFVLGDNRDRSQDSRSPSIGQIDCREILGKALFLFLPGTDEDDSPRDFSRIGGLT